MRNRLSRCEDLVRRAEELVVNAVGPDARQGQPAHFLARDDWYASLREAQIGDRIIPLVGDFAGGWIRSIELDDSDHVIVDADKKAADKNEYYKGKVVSLADLNDLQVELDIAQSDFARLGPMQKGIVTTDAYPDKSYDGQIAQIRSHFDLDPANWRGQAIVADLATTDGCRSLADAVADGDLAALFGGLFVGVVLLVRRPATRRVSIGWLVFAVPFATYLVVPLPTGAGEDRAGYG